MNKKKLYNSFWENGYIIIKNFITKEEINKIYSQINDLLDISLNQKNGAFVSKNLDKKYLYLKEKSLKLKSHMYDLTKYCDSLIKIAGSQKLLKISKLLLDSRTVLVDTPQVRIDHPEERLNLPQHQELNQISKDVITFWVPLVNISKKNGGIYFRPKTHELGHVKYKNSHLSAMQGGKKRAKIIDQLFKKKEYKKYKNLAPNLKAGDAVIFHSFIFHGTNPNLSKNIRWIYISRHNSINSAPYLKDETTSLRIPYDKDYNLF